VSADAERGSAVDRGAGRRPRILLVTRNLPPLRGGMERLVHHCYLELARAFDLTVFGPRGAEAHLEPGTPVRTMTLKPLGRFLAECAWQCVARARGYAPDLVFSGSGLTGLPALVAARRAGVPVVSYLHGLDVVADHPVYRGVFLPALRRCDGFVANSTHTRGLAVAAGIPPGRIRVLNPGVDTTASPDAADVAAFRDAAGADGRPLLLSVGRLTARKGLVEFVRDCLPEIVARVPGVLLLAIGGEANDAAAGPAAGMAGRIVQAAADAGVAGHVRLLGDVPDTTLAAAYRAADVLVFPVIERPRDVEGFGMVAIEAAARGTPTVAYAVGGVPDAVRDGLSGRLVAPGDHAAMTRAIVDVLLAPERFDREALRSFAEGYSWPRFGSRLRDICSEAIANGTLGPGAAVPSDHALARR
jgi:phosphatidyl-myo-inositol dimannoside synthase